MFDGLRLRLTSVYMLAVLALVIGVGGGAYALMTYYFDTSTDLALRYRAAIELRQRGADIPPDLLVAEREYAASSGKPLATPRPQTTVEGDDDSGAAHTSNDHREGEVRYQPEQAPIFALPLTSDGQLVVPINVVAAPISPNLEAVTSALAKGSDARIVSNSTGARVRLLTYRLDGAVGPAAIQVGRVLSDQDTILRGLLSGLLLLGLPVAMLVGGASWWMAGRSLLPARQAWERQQTFVANASHELRTPITLVRASTEVALRGLALAEHDRRELLQDVLQECDHMSRLVDDLLLLSRLDAGHMNIDQQQINLTELFDDVARQVGRLAEQRGIALNVATGNGVIRADPSRLRQVLLILLDNALRHTPPGGTVTISAQGSDTTAFVDLIVEDSGSGIDPAHLPHLFDRFYRVDSARGVGGGTGLGLAIAKGLIEAQQGRITIASELGHGTRVVVHMPAV
ncbi:MAG: ATP-binding protein [Roseiflexaceae bacterium]|nr:ATP-binding protein [Roseiflexaceae bacterium]